MKKFAKILLSLILSFTFLSLSVPTQKASALTSDFAFIILSQYKATADIGDQLHIAAVTSTGKSVTWKSSDSKIASVNTYGVVTAKKAGTAIITAKLKNAEASCQVTVNKTKVTISKEKASIERGETLRLSASTSNESPITWKSSKKSIATVDEYGKVTGLKPGETTITASADGTSAVCQVTVKLPTVQLKQASATLYRGKTLQLSATVSSSVKPTWKTNKKSVALVDATGTVTAIKHGTAIITATVDGVTQTCEITVQKPEITLSLTELTLNKGDSATLSAKVSSGNRPTWTSSNPNIVSVNAYGDVKALQKGKAYIYAAEDGTKVRCSVTVTQ
ncbi:MAG TPA: Ig domain-containing protein [Clostridiales bacterium]|nr:Ig domain-containing protein [Clostridiales bacterium]